MDMAYRPQTFNTRQMMHRNTFEIFHYRDQSLQDVALHHHDFYEVYCLLDGQVEYWVDGRVLRLQPGDLLLISPSELHRPLVNGAVYERIVLWINKAYLEGLTEDGQLSRCFDPSLPNLIRPNATERSALTAWLPF